ncbi:WhiB family transcriptional regulator [Pseudonocardia asaccharolytica]|uniref:4Fe-4S Wbl-type domain-containing protein n=1 Tax=Pseudonocardia asaccharolytica DSM 44247 = NBRC 16224 TaxID=1123024 RepID=A0A511D3G2_9PSEU|nr:WhiB family transcriptional regulator [Pseudonocardia asaccharolytica]GEL19321.1 hypothetical protein PA7_31580 [Pseudonocardia asaccharolytica DSM 44247 = NBRC 16224]
MAPKRSSNVTAIVGLCRGCHRAMAPAGCDIPGVAQTTDDPHHCASCLTWLRRHPGRDLADSLGHAHRPLPERPIADWSWRLDAACRDAGAGVFDPADVDERPHPPPAVARLAATVYCAACPVADECAAEADAHRYEGLWGGAWRWTPAWKPSAYKTVDLLADDATGVVA